MPLRAAVVSRMIKAAGYERSESWSTAIKGWHDYSTGFRCYQVTDDTVRVEWVISGWHVKNRDERERVQLEEIAEALAVRYQVEVIEGTFGPYIVVRK